MVIHAGFHKTGTTSAQTMIRINRTALDAHVRCYLRDDFMPLTRAARTFSTRPDADTLDAVRTAAIAFFDTIDPEDPRDILMSSEDLSGHLPGRHGLDRYDAAGLIMSQLADTARARFGAGFDLVFYFSTRSRDAWLRSTWWQNLRVTRLTLDQTDYADKITAAADLPAVLQEVAEAVAPETVTFQALEDIAALTFGPLTPLLDLLEIGEETRASLTAVAPENVQPELGLDAVFLALNRSGLNAKHLSEAKRGLLQLAKRAPARKSRKTG
ncbi:hypothetical protein [Puniceibacterium confluentis]